MTVLLWPNNLVTMARAAIVAALVLPMFAGLRWPPLIASVIFITGFWAFDYLDGWLARRLGRCSSFGESLDLGIDRFCDVLMSAYLLTAQPQHVPAILVFLLLRIAPDILVARFVGLSSNMFGTALREACPNSPLFTEKTVWLCIEINSLVKALFFCLALFWSSPAWTGFAIVVPALFFTGIVALVMREHAERVLAEAGDDPS